MQIKQLDTGKIFGLIQELLRNIFKSMYFPLDVAKTQLNSLDGLTRKFVKFTQNAINCSSVDENYIDKLVSLYYSIDELKNKLHTITLFMKLMHVDNIHDQEPEHRFALQPLSMQDCLAEIVEYYPFAEDKKFLFLDINEDNDFAFLGNKFVIKIILFGLLHCLMGWSKNFTAKTNVFITTYDDERWNRLQFQITNSIDYKSTSASAKIEQEFINALYFHKEILELIDGKMAIEISNSIALTINFPKLKQKIASPVKSYIYH